ncbi:tetratricopeptide repeat protein [Geoalkalibacter halelectricus]|uniref:tetratricopeptide repeat protein n=1 Tax=Geoalkalibacter halelectricus TaxID=2847045 RepID=UPI003D19A44B
MKKETWILAGAALVIGVLLGVIIANTGGKESAPARTATPPASAPNVMLQQNIQMLEEIVRKEPGNRSAWVQLGHNYFDSNQPMKAIEAYNKALEMDPNDPDVITNQGVMFRRVGWYDRAIENFRKANEMNPFHPQSLYNLGVVYRYDLQDLDKAHQVWSRYVELHPSGQGVEQLRAELRAIEALRQ